MPQKSNVSLERWHDLMRIFGLAGNDGIYNKLIAAYSEKHRAYHTLDHIQACFKHLDAVAEFSLYPHEIELAFWFYDAIYKPFSSTNEEDSAAWAVDFLKDQSVASDVIERIHRLIILTKEHERPHSMDEKIMLDIDLSILGTERSVYAQFEKDIRTEYKRAPFFIFKKKRKEILQMFLNREFLYETPHFRDLLEKRAKGNLAWAVQEL